MASGEVSTAIETFLLANWSTTKLLFENKNALAEDGTLLPTPDPIPYVEVSFAGRNYGQQSLGAPLQADNRWDEEGLLFLDVVVPRGDGTRTARTYAKSLCNLFRGLTLLSGGLEFLDAAIGRGEERKGNYYSIPVDVAWRRFDAPNA